MGRFIDERRHSQRVCARIRLTCVASYDGGRRTFAFETMDISMSGVLIAGDHGDCPFTVDTELRVSMYLDEVGVDSLEVIGRIVRVAGQNQFGLQFLSLSEENRRLFRVFLAGVAVGSKGRP